MHAIKKCIQFYLERRYKSYDIVILSSSQVAFPTFGFYENGIEDSTGQSGKTDLAT